MYENYHARMLSLRVGAHWCVCEPGHPGLAIGTIEPVEELLDQVCDAIGRPRFGAGEMQGLFAVSRDNAFEALELKCKYHNSAACALPNAHCSLAEAKKLMQIVATIALKAR